MNAFNFSGQEMVLLALTTACTGLLLLWYLFLRPSRSDAVPWSSAGMLESVANMASVDSPWFLIDEARKVGSTVYRLPMPIPGGLYVIGDGALARQILKDPTSDKPLVIYGNARILIGGLSIFSDSTKSHAWKVIRKATSPAFTSKEVHRMNAICIRNTNRWIRETLDPAVANGTCFDPSEEMVKLTLRVILESAFEYLATDDEIESFLENLDIATRELVMRQINNPIRKLFKWVVPEYYRAVAAAKRTHTLATRILKSYREKQQNMKEEEDSVNSVISLIVETPGLTDSQRIAEIMTFLIAGHDTTGYSLSSTLFLLSENPNIAQKLQNELREHENSNECKYLQHVIKESYRFYPVSALGSARSLDYDFTFRWANSEMRIPKGCNFQVTFALIHRDERVFTNPDVFDPSRWENATPEMNSSLMPFSLGSRNCIGQALATAEMQSVLPRLIRDYTFKTKDKGRLETFLTLKVTGCQMIAKKV